MDCTAAHGDTAAQYTPAGGGVGSLPLRTESDRATAAHQTPTGNAGAAQLALAGEIDGTARPEGLKQSQKGRRLQF